MESVEYHSALAALAWQIELGADESIGDVPVNRYDIAVAAPKPAVDVVVMPAVEMPLSPPVTMSGVDAVAVARAAADAAQDLEGLRAAMAAFDLCDMKLGARNLVFSDGMPGARVMIVGEAPNVDEDREGRPFVGAVGHFLDRMLAAVDLSRDPSAASGGVGHQSPVYVTSILPWRPPQDREPSPDELAMMLPFLHRHIALANPDLLVVMGNQACQALLGKRGITRLRGDWTEVVGKPVLPMFNPAYLLKTPAAKRETWADLLSLKARLRDG